MGDDLQNKRKKQKSIMNVEEEDVVTTTASENDKARKEKIYENCFCKILGHIATQDISRVDLHMYKIFISYAWDDDIYGGFTKRHAQELARYLKNSGFKHVIFDGDNGGEYKLPGLLKHLQTSDIIILLVTPVLNQKLLDLAHPHVIRDEVNIITQHLSNTEWKGQIIPILLQGTKESLPNAPSWRNLVYEDFTSVFESKLNTDESQDYYSLFFSLLERILKSKSILPSRNREFRTEVKEVLQLVTNTTSSPTPRRVLGGDLPILSNFIYGREATIEKSQRLLQENKRLILSGMAGVGKTSIGLKVMEKINFQTIWFMDTKDSEIELLTIYKRMVCDEFKIQFDDEKEMDIPGKLETILRNKAKQRNTSLLIVFENVDHDALRIKIEKEFIFKEISDTVFVMILTRCDVTGTTKIPVMNIPLLNDDDATRLLFHYSSNESYQEPLMDDILEKCKENISKLNENDHNVLKQLAIVLLGKHPLAITLAGSAKREFYSESWTDLKTKWTDLITNVYSSSSSLDDPRSLVAPSIRLSIDHLNEEQLGVLQNISFWGSRETDIPLTWVSESSSQISILVSLKRLNLVQELVLGAQSRVSCHSLVTESVWSNLSSTQRINVGTHCIQLSLEEDSVSLSIEGRKQRVNCLSYLVVENSRSITHDDSFSSLLKIYGNIAGDSGMYRAGIPILRLALDIDKKSLGEESSVVATDLNNLAELLCAHGKYDEARPLHEESLAVRRKILGEEHPHVAQSLNNFAQLLQDQGKLDEAEKLTRQALDIQFKTQGPDNPQYASYLNNLAQLLQDQGKLDEAKPLMQQSLAIDKKVYGEDRPAVAIDLNNLALLLKTQGKLAEAEPLLHQSLAIRKKTLGGDHPDVAQSLNNLAELLRDQGKYDEAKPYYEQAVGIWKKALGEEHPLVATGLNNLAQLLSDQGKYDEAEPLYRQALTIDRKVHGGDDHPDIACHLNNLALLLYNQGKYDEARPLIDQSLAIRKKVLGDLHPDVAQSLNNLAVLLRDQGKVVEARKLGKQAFGIALKSLGENHPSTIDYKYWETF